MVQQLNSSTLSSLAKIGGELRHACDHKSAKIYYHVCDSESNTTLVKLEAEDDYVGIDSASLDVKHVRGQQDLRCVATWGVRYTCTICSLSAGLPFGKRRNCSVFDWCGSISSISISVFPRLRCFHAMLHVITANAARTSTRETCSTGTYLELVQHPPPLLLPPPPLLLWTLVLVLADVGFIPCDAAKASGLTFVGELPLAVPTQASNKGTAEARQASPLHPRIYAATAASKIENTKWQDTPAECSVGCCDVCTHHCIWSGAVR